jgi:hypothetical protein
MKAIDRRRLLGGILCGAVAAAAGLALTSAPIEAMPFDASVAGSLNEMIEKAQVVVGARFRVVLATVITAAGAAGGTEVVASVAGVDTEPPVRSFLFLRQVTRADAPPAIAIRYDHAAVPTGSPVARRTSVSRPTIRPRPS